LLDQIRAQAFPRPTLKRLVPSAGMRNQSDVLSDARYVALPDGRMHLAATAFIMSLARTGNAVTVHQYARIIVDFLCVLDEANGGKGIPLAGLNDEILLRWQVSQLQHRDVGVKVFRERLTLVLRFILYAQNNGWIPRILGDQLDDSIIIRWDGHNMRHPLHEGTAKKPEPALKDHADLRALDAQVELQSKSALTQKSHGLLSKVLRAAALRRSEGLRVTVDDIPSKIALERQKRRVAAGVGEPVVSFKIVSSKKGGEKEISIPLTLAVELREHIDTERAELLRRKGISAKEVRAIFLSQKTGRALVPQSVTNFYKRAARAAANRLGQPNLRDISPHDERHRGITDFARECLASGVSPAETMYKVLQFGRLSRLSTAFIYVHLAEKEMGRRPSSAERTSKKAQGEIHELTMMERSF
jgi:integrase